jgi:hypothetical protein
MRMLKDWVPFTYYASVAWPVLDSQTDWVLGVESVESWLNSRVGSRLQWWAWGYPGHEDHYALALSFKQDSHRLLFCLSWETARCV